AHSVMVKGGRLRKGRVLSEADLGALAEAGLAEVTVARLEPGDLPEDEAAARVAAALAPAAAAQGLSVQAPFTGRVNFHAERRGVLSVDAGAVVRLNAVDEAVTLATLPDHSRVEARDMIATVKILPYAVPAAIAEAAIAALGERPVLTVHGIARRDAALIATRIPGMKESVVRKGLESVRSRLAALELGVASEAVVPHETQAVTRAVAEAPGDMVLILGGSATQDREDVGPAAVVAAGGRILRFGMPVDPGNLLFLGELGSRPVVGLPGCVRSPALNGADWVLERLACGIAVGDAEIAAMGVGGLLKEIPSRPQPREGAVVAKARPVVEAILLAAGAARRMRGADKLLEPVAGEPLLRRAARACLGAQVRAVHVVLPVPDGPRQAALSGLALDRVPNPAAEEGMASSIRAGMGRIGDDVDAVILAFADMPEMGAAHLDRLIAAFDPVEGREICRAVSAGGQPGHPVLFGRRFFESLRGLTGDRGARDVLREAGAFVVDVPTPGEGAIVDLDTPEAWAAWRRAQGA
ncbi:MAG TPA: molybdopterin-binding/glycosyltransferase family 2 protein, partial [Paracoccaceae bacterium]|nr:molybdopterin-binding/glycosyltransferase family 2 protein [Paracoccaceae bacterium]